MGHTLTQEIVDIYEFPAVDKLLKARDKYQVTIGDMHANAAKLLFACCKHGFIDITQDDYNQFIKLYHKETLTAEDIKSFKEIIARIKVFPEAKESLLRLIGDLLTDRGQNDYFILKLLEVLVDNGVPVEILISNHDAEFIRCLEQGLGFDKIILEKSQGKSAVKLQELIQKGLVTREEIISLYNKCIKPNLKALSYSFNDNQDKLTIYSHGPIGLKNIEYMAKRLGVPYLGDEPILIAKTIDAINEKFSEYVSQNKLSELLDVHHVPQDAINGRQPIDPEKFPFAHLIWNRKTDDLVRPHHIYFVHGHHMESDSYRNVFNLDNILGKMKTVHNGQYNVLYSKEVSKLRDIATQVSGLIKTKSASLLRKSQEKVVDKLLVQREIAAELAQGKLLTNDAASFMNQEDLIEKIATIISTPRPQPVAYQPSIVKGAFTAFYDSYIKDYYGQFLSVKDGLGNLFRHRPQAVN
ncbi:MAG: metallophosphoesterase [Proteobacteria bacterium]|nr:metallophosphoesterase [Pseudomonadota bacterium]